VAYSGLYGQDKHGLPTPDTIAPESYVAAIRGLGPGITEFGCHPGYPEGLDSDYQSERAIELQALCDARVRAAVDETGVRLITWADVDGN
jgi:predicted glycoside hydrolase/deacetylase ChbG (UPF0249 family)